MKLEDLKPKEVLFTVSDVDLTFRPFTIADDLKAKELCGGQKKLFEVFDKFDFDKISLLAWYQLTLESQKRVLKAIEGIFLDPETGQEKKANLKPIEKFRNLFLGYADQILLITKLLECRGINIPDLNDEAALKNWIDQLMEISPLTGHTSST